MASIKYRLKGKSQNASIYLRLSIDRNNVIEKKTGLSINPKDWSRSTSFPKQTSAKNKKLISDLRKLEIKILDKVTDGQSEGISFSSKWLGDQIDIHFSRKTESGLSEYVTDAIDSIIKSAPQRKNNKGGIGLSKSRINDYKALKRIVIEYEGERKTKVKQVNKQYGERMLTYLLEAQNYEKGYALRIMDNLKSVCRDAASNGVEVSPQLNKITGGKLKNEYIVFLNPEELIQIKNAKIRTPHLENARTWLLIGCLIGQRGNDLLNLTSENFKTLGNLEVIELTQKKGNKKVTIPVTEELKSLISLGMPRKISLQRFNEYIKEVCRIAEVTSPTKGRKRDPEKNRYITGTFPKHELVTSHICRRSFATNLYGEMPTSLIMQITGHSSEKTFLGYIGKSGLDYAQQIANYMILQRQKAQKEFKLKAVK